MHRNAPGSVVPAVAAAFVSVVAPATTTSLGSTLL